MRKKILSILALLCLTVSSAWADVVASGTCGTKDHELDVKWTLTGESQNYTLTISDSGDMANYTRDYEWSPWYNSRADIVSIIIESGVTRIGDYAFCNCTSLTSIDIPNTVTHINEFAFDGCSGLTSITIPNSVREINECAFVGCSNLKTVTIGSGVERIGNCAFQSCTSLKSVNIYATNAPTLEINYHGVSQAFEGNATDRKIYVFNNLKVR